MATKTLRYGKGYAGKSGIKVWIARITGKDPKKGFAREFVEADRVEKEHFNRSRTMVDLHFDLSDGLYEASESGERWFFIVTPAKDTGESKTFGVSVDRAKAIATLLDDGQSFNEARLSTKSVEK